MYIRLVGCEQQFLVRHGKSVLESLLPVQNRLIVAGCHGGGCGVCKIKVHSGEYQRGVMSKAHITLDEAEQGYSLACRTYPTSDILIEATSPPDLSSTTI